jgi:two-component system CheB/CheR fusion protein
LKPGKHQKPSSFKPIPLVGLGAPAGGLEALETFFLHMPPNPGMAFVIIQHLSPKHKSILREILKRDTQVKAGQEVRRPLGSRWE